MPAVLSNFDEPFAAISHSVFAPYDFHHGTATMLGHTAEGHKPESFNYGRLRWCVGCLKIYKSVCGSPQFSLAKSTIDEVAGIRVRIASVKPTEVPVLGTAIRTTKLNILTDHSMIVWPNHWDGVLQFA
jgi:hypothetical protein